VLPAFLLGNLALHWICTPCATAYFRRGTAGKDVVAFRFGTRGNPGLTMR